MRQNVEFFDYIENEALKIFHSFGPEFCELFNGFSLSYL